MMAMRNNSPVSEFILTGLSDRPELQMPLFFLFLGIYVVTVVGNLGMIILIGISSHLHTPMYYLLSSLSFIDLCHSTVITPKMLVKFVSMNNNIISYSECMTQLYFFLTFAIAECHMLAVMAYDRYVAVCRPLLYNITMSHQTCSWLVGGVYLLGLVGATAHTSCTLRVLFCKNVISHYFCELLSLLKLSCSSTYVNEVVILCLSAFNLLLPTISIVSSYISIISSILHIRSTEGRSKAFSTCSSHMSAVALFYGAAAFIYLQPSSGNSTDQEKVASVFYTICVPMLNPLIYSLRNKDVKVAMRKVLERRKFI